MNAVTLLLCCRRSCGHVLLGSERVWSASKSIPGSKSAVCPMCGYVEFYQLDERGKKLTLSDRPSAIDPRDIHPYPQMGVKLRKRVMAARNRALGVTCDLEFASRLSSAIRKTGLSMDAFCNSSGLSRSDLDSLTCGSRDPDLKALERIVPLIRSTTNAAWLITGTL